MSAFTFQRLAGAADATSAVAAIANAVYHATGTRVRSLPISIEKLLGHESAGARTNSPVEAIVGTAVSASHKGV